MKRTGRYNEDVPALEAEIAKLRSYLKQALRQWAMYAEMVERNDGFEFATEKSLEGDMYRNAIAFVDLCRDNAKDERK